MKKDLIQKLLHLLAPKSPNLYTNIFLKVLERSIPPFLRTLVMAVEEENTENLPRNQNGNLLKNQKGNHIGKLES